MAKILVIDDDPITLRVASAVLSKAGHEIVSMSLGSEALKFLKTDEQVDLILSDIMMPALDGFDLLKTVKNNTKTSNLPVILCSCLNDQASVVRGIQLGAAGYISKPFQPDILIEKVNDVLSVSQPAILVVDKEEVLRNLLVRILTRGGYKAIGVDSASAALEITKKENISLVITEATMPDMSGIELLAWFKKEKPDLPVILMTGRSNEKIASKALSAGAASIITKPFQNTKIISDIKDIIL